jgi:hypothetical protein
MDIDLDDIPIQPRDAESEYEVESGLGPHYEIVHAGYECLRHESRKEPEPMSLFLRIVWIADDTLGAVDKPCAVAGINAGLKPSLPISRYCLLDRRGPEECLPETPLVGCFT